MARIHWKDFEPSKRKKALDQLCEVLVTYDKPEEIKFMLERLLTEGEVIMLSRRLQIAEYLIGGLTYDQIQKKMNAGASTIREVDRWLTDAAYEYRLIRDEKRRATEQNDKRRKSTAAPSKRLLRAVARDPRLILFRLLVDDL